MFQNADRIPMDALQFAPPAAMRPWGLRRMAPYKSTSVVGAIATHIDPATQMGAAADGELIDAKHKRSNVATEKSTATNKGDGAGSGSDEDHSQDSEQD
ncbi:putative ATP-grasp-modified RiPP [Actinomadura logoneensis]|uniref:Putative ATP-grasp-modified RiPP n=1 Tax=Actinomadura logoneensis TaxID=2293572 RepID=A0A372J9W0_9ACTN|nr:putative ATP-grasp-modified RiPP [Actinomadura logoneensis]RFU36594.1 putative ATP-grasp-modified RiPP [Actinomadura logoneensis]